VQVDAPTGDLGCEGLGGEVVEGGERLGTEGVEGVVEAVVPPPDPTAQPGMDETKAPMASASSAGASTTASVVGQGEQAASRSSMSGR